ncbi:WD40 repeat domain-containing serine/threonine protein kinase [Nonomuraea gerenzanensis]|uniref:Tyrosine protein kinase:Serine/threonine protein kinase n=1 Tax=Nonomuraea gerenzanensis TaxID=93944 RepID=A0A1M4E519_9ACTN|nr:serine/threonine-protein kinase [Nonomuraea gerenzanensis]UBU16069.1 serine/threonine-protein kinase [Nonomuraea gerenzanensis]SBO93872.1 Tyrosine protein kinase:Serine/threonine protein kinase [Nonomuraea gerenzanensis]
MSGFELRNASVDGRRVQTPNQMAVAVIQPVMGNALIDGDPQRLGDYWLAGRLGAGGQGVVYEGYDPAGTRVAIKVLSGDPVRDPGLRDGMVKEAVSAQRVASFCTARVLDADLEGPRPYLVSEYVEGPSLRSAGRTFEGGELHRLATAIATALTAIHDAGVVHRDLKPDNVLLGPDGPRVIDFGIARTVEMSLTSTGLVKGTPGYMAPEVFSGERAGPAADVFAWGAVVWFAATGRDPFTGEALGAVMHRVLSHDPDLDVLPESLRGPVRAALSKEPVQRPSARELLLALISGDGSLDTPRLLTGDGDSGLDTSRLLTRDGALDLPRLLALGAGDGRRIGAPADDPALGVLAEDAYATLAPEDKELAPELFLRLVTVTDEGELALRRPRRSELPDGVDRVLAAFPYLVSDTDPVRLLRPALPLAWPRLRAWIEADRDGLAVHRRISTAAGRWQEHGRKDADLFSGSTLDHALSWAAAGRRNITLTPAERDFLAAAAALTRRRSRRTRLAAMGLAVLLVLALAAGALAGWQSLTLAEQGDKLAQQRDAAESARLAAAADAARGQDPVLGMLLSAAAGRLSPTDEARSSLVASVTDPAVAVFHDPATRPDVVRALTPDGRSLISADPGEVKVWDVGTGRRTGGFTGLPGRQLRQVAASADGRLLAIADDQGVGVRELATGRAVGKRLEAPQEVDLTVAFSGGRLLVTIGQGVYVYDWRTGKAVSLPTMAGVAVHPDGTYAVAGPTIWSLPSGKGRAGFRGVCADCASFPAFSRDGRRLAVSDDAGLTVYDTRTREEIDGIAGWEPGAVPVFSPDGRLIAGVGERVTVWRLGDDEPLQLGREPDDRPSAAAFAPGGLRYLSEGTVVTLKPAPPAAKELDGVRLSEGGGSTLTHALGSTKVTLNGKQLEAGSFEAYDAEFTFSRDGRRLAIRRGDQVSVRDTATWRELASLTPGFSAVSEPDTALPTAKGLWTAGEKTFTLWSLPGGQRLKQVPRPRLLGWAAGADGRLVGLDADRLRVVDLETGRPVGAAMTLPAQPQNVWFSPDLKRVAVLFSGKAGVWDTATGAQAGDWLRVDGAAWDGVFSPDGRLFAFASQDNTLSLWDVAQGRRVGPVVGLSDSARSLTFTAGSAELLAIGRDGVRTSLPTTVERLAETACARAGRALTEAEWRRYLPGRPFERSCPTAAAFRG